MIKRARIKPSPARLSRDADRLVRYTRALSVSGSAVEARFWDHRITAKLAEHMRGADVAIEAALSHLHGSASDAYEILVDLCERRAETSTIDSQQILLVAAPVIAWSKYSIASGEFADSVLETFREAFVSHVAASGTAVAMMPFLYSIDQLPRGFSETRALSEALGKSALDPNHALPRVVASQETASLLADTRFLLAAIVAPIDAPLFRWQEVSDTQKATATRTDALNGWRAATRDPLATLIPGCVVDVVLPDGYHSACRASEVSIRPYGVYAAVSYLETVLEMPANEIRAVVATFGTDEADEFRIGFTKGLSGDVIHGVVWPFYGTGDGERTDLEGDAVRSVLTEAGVTQVLMLDELFPLEFCDDCGTPLYADPGSNLVHPEPPDDFEPSHMHLH